MVAHETQDSYWSCNVLYVKPFVQLNRCCFLYFVCSVTRVIAPRYVVDEMNEMDPNCKVLTLLYIGRGCQVTMRLIN